jgi:acyl carrier protein
MTRDDLTDQTIQRLLVTVGADPGIDAAQLDTSFADLDLDSLARTEFACRIKEITGFDVEDDIAPTTTPNEVRALVLAQLRDGLNV